MLSVMGAFAEVERALIRERQREGIMLSKQRGAYRGRKKSLNSEQIVELKRPEHLVELQTVFGFKSFTMSHYRKAVHTLTEPALQTDKGIVLASSLVENLRRQSIILPAMNATERIDLLQYSRLNATDPKA